MMYSEFDSHRDHIWSSGACGLETFLMVTRASLAGGWTPPATLAQGKEECN